MTPDVTEAEATPAFQEGIYLEEKSSTIGTGSTAKTAQYRSFWVTLSVAEHTAVMVLLNDDFRPTPIKETYALETLSGPGWHYIAEGQKRYAMLRPHLDRMLAQAAAAATPKPAPEKAAGGNWWGGGATKISAPKKKETPKKKSNWWDG